MLGYIPCCSPVLWSMSWVLLINSLSPCSMKVWKSTLSFVATLVSLFSKHFPCIGTGSWHWYSCWLRHWHWSLQWLLNLLLPLFSNGKVYTIFKIVFLITWQIIDHTFSHLSWSKPHSIVGIAKHCIHMVQHCCIRDSRLLPGWGMWVSPNSNF